MMTVVRSDYWYQLLVGNFVADDISDPLYLLHYDQVFKRRFGS